MLICHKKCLTSHVTSRETEWFMNGVTALFYVIFNKGGKQSFQKF